MDGMDAKEWMDLVVARAGDLRERGILAIGAEGYSATFAPAAPKPVELPKASQQAEERRPSALNDDASYADGQVPGFTIGKLDELPPHYGG